MLLFSDSSDVLALVERIKFNIEIQRVFSELYVCASEGQEERQRGAGEERQCEGKQTEERPGKISVKTRFYRCFQTTKKRTLHSLFPGGSQIQYRAIANWICFKNLLSLILINNLIFCCNDRLKVSTVNFSSSSSCLFFTWLYPGKHLTKTSINWQISRRQQRKLSSHSKVRLTCSECQSSLCLFVVPPPFGSLESKGRRKWPKAMFA